MNIYEEKINKLNVEIKKLKLNQEKKAKNINTCLWLLILTIDILIYIKFSNISLFNKYHNVLIDILRYLSTFCSIVVTDVITYFIGDNINYKIYLKEEQKIKSLKKEIDNIKYYKNTIKKEENINFYKPILNNENKLYRVRKKD